MWRESANPHRIRKESSTNSDNRIILKKKTKEKQINWKPDQKETLSRPHNWKAERKSANPLGTARNPPGTRQEPANDPPGIRKGYGGCRGRLELSVKIGRSSETVVGAERCYAASNPQLPGAKPNRRTTLPSVWKCDIEAPFLMSCNHPSVRSV